MKLTLRFTSPASTANDYLTAFYSGTPQVASTRRPAGYVTDNSIGHLLASWGYWVNTQPGVMPGNKTTSTLPNAISVEKPYLLRNHPYSPGLTTISTLKTTLTSSPQTDPSRLSSSPDVWSFCFAEQVLCNSAACIQLTNIESMLIQTLTRSNERVCSKQELILGINKDAYSYSGLEMCLSRLQSKFRRAFNERLFRSVRNRGYCLVQDVQIIE